MRDPYLSRRMQLLPVLAIPSLTISHLSLFPIIPDQSEIARVHAKWRECRHAYLSRRMKLLPVLVHLSVQRAPRVVHLGQLRLHLLPGAATLRIQSINQFIISGNCCGWGLDGVCSTSKVSAN